MRGIQQQLTLAFNQMRADLGALREQERASTDTFTSLNRDLSEQLCKVEQLIVVGKFTDRNGLTTPVR